MGRGYRYGGPGARALVVALALVTALPRLAQAAPDHAPILVFESHVGDRPAALAPLLDMLEASLETHGFAARAASIRTLLGGRAPLPGVTDVGISAADIAQAVEAGLHAYVNGKYEEAVGKMTAALGKIERNPGALVSDTRNADIVTRANMILALAQARLGRTDDSAATMTELIRVTRAQPISRAEYGPDADKLYRAVLKQVQTGGRGRLTITTGDDRALIFVDGSLRGMGKAMLGDLIVGRYRVFVQVPGTTGRHYAITVEAEQDHTLSVDAEAEEALIVADGWIGFRFLTQAERKQEGRLAANLARRWSGDGMVVVIGAAEVEGRPALAGTLYRTDGTVVRSASIETEGADRDRIRSLAKFIADGTPDEHLDVLSGGRVAPVAPSGKREQARARWPIVVAAGGLGLIAAGATLLVLDEDPDPIGPQEPTYRDTATAGVVIGAAGVAAAAIGAWWWLRGSHADESGRPAIAVGRSSAVLGWTARF